MNDPISRQAAIDAIEKNAYRHTYLDQIVEIVSKLPSAKLATDLQFLHPESEYVFYDSDHGFCINTQDVLDCLRKELRNG